MRIFVLIAHAEFGRYKWVLLISSGPSRGIDCQVYIRKKCYPLIIKKTIYFNKSKVKNVLKNR